jgi:N-acetylneuraminate synthase
MMKTRHNRETVLIAEVGINHNGDIELAKRLIDVAADARCDFVKFQKRTIDLVYTKEELDAPRESPWGTTNREQKFGLEFTSAEYDEIDRHCRTRGIGWFASCWDVESVGFMDRYDVDHHKVASALLTDTRLLAAMAMSGRGTILSTGMSTVREIRHAVETLGSSLECIMHCTSTYPTVPDEMNLSVIDTMVCERLILHGSADAQKNCEVPPGVLVGFSNHYSGLLWVPMVVALRAQVLEFHVTLDRTMYGSDQAASIEPEGVKRLVEHVELAERMLGDGFKHVYDSELPVKKKLRKS